MEFIGQICVCENPDLLRVILEEAHSSTYVVHPGSTKIYHIIKENYWWSCMKPEITKFVVKCLI